MVKAQSLFFIIGAVQTVGILVFFDIKSEHDHGVYKTDLIMFREREDGKRLFLAFMKQK